VDKAKMLTLVRGYHIAFLYNWALCYDAGVIIILAITRAMHGQNYYLLRSVERYYMMSMLYIISTSCASPHVSLFLLEKPV
jgi:hypothetical protein